MSGYRLSVTIGLNVGNTPLTDEQVKPLLAYVRETLAEDFGGVTVIRATGAWYNERGIFTSEDNLIVYVLCDAIDGGNYALFRARANEFRVLFNQESVLIDCQKLDYEFIS